MPFKLPFIKPLSPVYFVGDSNTLLYRYLTLDIPEYFARPILTNCCFIKGLSGESIMAGADLHPEIISFFYRDHILEFKERWLRYSKTQLTNEEWTVFYAGAPPLQDIYNHDDTLALVVMVGTLDLAYLLAQLGTNVDFILDDPDYVDSAFSGPHLPLVPLAPVRELISRRLAPIGEALRTLRSMGFDDLYLHSLHPPTVDDLRYHRARQITSSAKIRYKVTILINRVLERLAHESGARFLNMWPRTVIGGVLDPTLELDGDHLNRGAADLTLHELLNDLAIRYSAVKPL